MSRVLTTANLRLSRRYHAVAAGEAPRVLQTAAAEKSGRVTKKEGTFWMRDPKTGNWIPENRFADVDAVELRAKLLPKK